MRTRRKKFNALVQDGVEVLDGHRLLSIGESGASFLRLSDEETITVTADYVVMSLGVRPNRELWNSVSAAYGNRAFLVGDVDRAGMIHDAVFSGFNVGWNLDAENCEL